MKNTVDIYSRCPICQHITIQTMEASEYSMHGALKKECEICADQLKRIFDYRGVASQPSLSITQPILVLKNDNETDRPVTALIRQTNVRRLKELLSDGIYHQDYQRRELRYIKNLLSKKKTASSTELFSAIQNYVKIGYDVVELIDTIQRYCGVNVELTCHHTGLLEITWMSPEEELVSITFE